MLSPERGSCDRQPRFGQLHSRLFEQELGRDKECTHTNDNKLTMWELEIRAAAMNIDLGTENVACHS